MLSFRAPYKVNRSSFREDPIVSLKAGMVRRAVQGSFAPQFTRPNALDDPMVQVARVVAVSVVSPSRGESFVGCCGYMVRANAPIGSEIRSRRGAIGYVTAGLSFNPAMRCSTTSRQALHLRSAARPYMESKVDD
jgi:hypothetical protein